MHFWDSAAFTYALLPAMIFLSRIVDVTMGTVRIISLSRGHKFAAPLLGFFEVLIWIIVIGKIMENLNNWTCYIAYAGGFAMGNYVGILLENKVAMGSVVVRIITPRDTKQLMTALKESGYGATRVSGRGVVGDVSLIYSVVKRSHLNEVIELVEKHNPKAFYSVEDIRHLNEGVFPDKPHLSALAWFRRKAK